MLFTTTFTSIIYESTFSNNNKFITNTKSNTFFVDYFPQKHFQRCQLKCDVFFEVKEDILMKNVLIFLLYCNFYYETKKNYESKLKGKCTSQRSNSISCYLQLQVINTNLNYTIRLVKKVFQEC